MDNEKRKVTKEEIAFLKKLQAEISHNQLFVIHGIPQYWAIQYTETVHRVQKGFHDGIMMYDTINEETYSNLDMIASKMGEILPELFKDKWSLHYKDTTDFEVIVSGNAGTAYHFHDIDELVEHINTHSSYRLDIDRIRAEQRYAACNIFLSLEEAQEYLKNSPQLPADAHAVAVNTESKQMKQLYKILSEVDLDLLSPEG